MAFSQHSPTVLSSFGCELKLWQHCWGAGNPWGAGILCLEFWNPHKKQELVQFTFLTKTIHKSVNSNNSNLCVSDVLSKGRMNCTLEDISILSGVCQLKPSRLHTHLKNVEVLLPNKQQVTEKLFDWGLFGISSATHSTVTAKTDSPEGLQLSAHLTYENTNSSTFHL